MSMKKPSGMHLLKGEKVVFYSRKSWLSEWILLFLGIITIWIFGVGLIFFLLAFLKIYGTEYALTTRRFYCKYGLISRKVSEAHLENITDVSIGQTIIGRLLNFGNVVIHTAGTGPRQMVMVDVPNPKRVALKIRELIKTSREDAGLKRRLERIEDEYLMGKISKEQYQLARSRLMKKYGKIKVKKKKVRKS